MPNCLQFYSIEQIEAAFGGTVRTADDEDHEKPKRRARDDDEEAKPRRKPAADNDNSGPRSTRKPKDEDEEAPFEEMKNPRSRSGVAAPPDDDEEPEGQAQQACTG